MKWILNSPRPSLNAARAVLLILVAAFSLGGPLRLAQAQTPGPHYVVPEGEALSTIAYRFGVTIDALVAANPGLNPDLVRAGAALTIPGSPALAGTLTTHPLEQGETLASLAHRFGQQPATLVQLNGVLNPEQLYFNEEIVLLEQGDALTAVPAGRAYPATAQLGLLGLSAAHNQNPWALAATNQLAPARLLPPVGTAGRAHGYKWLIWMTNSLQAALLSYFYPERWMNPGNVAAAAELKAHAQERVGVLLDQLDAELARHGGPWLLGADYSVLDAYSLMLCRWTRNFSSAPARVRPQLGPHMARVLERPAVQRVFATERLALTDI